MDGRKANIDNIITMRLGDPANSGSGDKAMTALLLRMSDAAVVAMGDAAFRSFAAYANEEKTEGVLLFHTFKMLLDPSAAARPRDLSTTQVPARAQYVPGTGVADMSTMRYQAPLSLLVTKLLAVCKQQALDHCATRATATPKVHWCVVGSVAQWWRRACLREARLWCAVQGVDGAIGVGRASQGLPATGGLLGRCDADSGAKGHVRSPRRCFAMVRPGPHPLHRPDRHAHSKQPVAA